VDRAFYALLVLSSLNSIASVYVEGPKPRERERKQIAQRTRRRRGSNSRSFGRSSTLPNRSGSTRGRRRLDTRGRRRCAGVATIRTSSTRSAPRSPPVAGVPEP